MALTQALQDIAKTYRQGAVAWIAAQGRQGAVVVEVEQQGLGLGDRLLQRCEIAHTGSSRNHNDS